MKLLNRMAPGFQEASHGARISRVLGAKGYRAASERCAGQFQGTILPSGHEDPTLDAVIQLSMAGKIVGWAQGACEFGPRALGNRSVLASPWAPYARENLNDFIKWRPRFEL